MTDTPVDVHKDCEKTIMQLREERDAIAADRETTAAALAVAQKAHRAVEQYASKLTDAHDRVHNDRAVVLGERERLAEVLRRVGELHARRVYPGDGFTTELCVECGQQWPCATQQLGLDPMGDDR